MPLDYRLIKWIIRQPPPTISSKQGNGQLINFLKSEKTYDRTQKVIKLFYLIQKRGKSRKSFKHGLLVLHFRVSRAFLFALSRSKMAGLRRISREQTKSTFHKACKLDQSYKNNANKLVNFQTDGWINKRLEILIASHTCLNFLKKWA